MHLKISLQPDQEARVRRLAPSAFESLLMDVLGKEVLGIVNLDIPHNERNQIDYDGRQQCCIWVEDITEAAGGATSLFNSLVQRFLLAQEP